MKATFRASVLALAVCAASGPAAAEGMGLYDNFQSTTLNSAKWVEGERSRMINVLLDGANLRLVQRDWGSTASDSGASPGTSWSETIARSGPVTRLRATLKVAAVDVKGCAANSTTTTARARIIGSFFNTGNRSAGSNLGDVLAQMYAQADSADAPGSPLRVRGLLILCTASDCSTSTQIGSSVNLGTAAPQTNVTMQVDWDRANKQFLFSRDKGTPTAVSYAGIDDSADPGAVFQNVSTRTTVANCTGDPRPYAYIDARFDNVVVNKGAKP